jgi:hypothetical protein
MRRARRYAKRAPEKRMQDGKRPQEGREDQHPRGDLRPRRNGCVRKVVWKDTLALSHARSGSSAMLSGHMGKSDAFDRAIVAFALAKLTRTKRPTPLLTVQSARAV